MDSSSSISTASPPVSIALCADPTQNGNGSCDTSLDSNIAPFDQLGLRITYIVIGCLGVTGNSLVVFVIFTYTSMKKKLTNIFIINQSLIDLVASMFILLLGIFEIEDTNMEAGNLHDELVCCLWLTRAPLWSMLMSSTYNLVALTVERYFEIVHPIAHKIKFSRNKAFVGMAATWLIGPIYNLAYEVPTSKIIGGRCYPFSIWPSKGVQSFVGVLTVLLQFILPMTIMIYCYTKIALVIKNRVVPGGSSSNTFERAKKNIIKTLVIMCICFILCWTWNEVFIFLYFVGYPTEFSSPFYHFTVVAVFANSCLNPFIYTAKYEQFQRGLNKICCKCSLKHSSGEAASDPDNTNPHNTTAVSVVPMAN